MAEHQTKYMVTQNKLKYRELTLVWFICICTDLIEI